MKYIVKNETCVNTAQKRHVSLRIDMGPRPRLSTYRDPYSEINPENNVTTHFSCRYCKCTRGATF